MIKITSLNKIYKSKKRKTCHAVKNINLTLPDAGLVFVLGKSGSGKSTLLNLIGGLDNITSGTIEVDGNDLSTFKEKDFCNYRNTHIGFIFQDYHLIDELTVYENIVLSLNLRRIEDKELVKAALAKVDLAGYEDRYPTELSGGEQQRVAIARAIVKNPRIILADEPTGNLDTHTAKSIVELLKELSKDCLILIVSHNVNDANAYADRIIELAKGKIISDKSRNPEFASEIVLKEDTLIYPDGQSLSDKDIDLLNENVHKKIIKRTDKFIESADNTGKATKIKIENKRLSPRRELSLSGKFLKNKTLAISLSAFMVSVIMVIMALAQTIVNFNGSHIIADEMSKMSQSSVLMNKVVDEQTRAQLDKTYPVKIGDGDIQALYDSGYKGDIYPVYSHSLVLRNTGTYWGNNTNHFFNGVFMSETFGTMIVDDEFLDRKFDGLELVAKAEHIMPYGIYITDYVADCVLAISDAYNKGDKTYDDIVGEFLIAGYRAPRMYVNGIIKTDYAEKYSDLLEAAKKGQIDSGQMLENEKAQELYNEIYEKLGYCYSTNPDFVSDFLKTPMADFPAHYKLSFNGVIDYYKPSKPYSTGYKYITNADLAPNQLVGNWLYSDFVPEIPEGAKYIRVAFCNDLDRYYGIANEIAQLDYAILRFDDGEPIPKEIMNYQKSNSSDGIHLNGYTGEINYSQMGAGLTYLSDYVEIPEGAKITELTTIALMQEYPNINAYCVFYDENKEYVSGEHVRSGTTLNDDEVMMCYTDYNAIFGTEYDVTNMDTFVPHTVTLSHYEYSDVNNENPLFTREIKIVGLMSSSHTFYLSDNLNELFKEDFVRPYSLYFDGTEGIGKALDAAGDLYYEPQSMSVEGIHTMTKAVDVFIPIFELISIFLYVGVIFILMNFASKMINDKMHEIGILKALGTKNGTIGVVFGLQVMLIAILTCGLSTLGYYLFIDVANDILIESIRSIAPSWTLPDLQFLTFKWDIALMNCALTLALAIISLIAPMIKIKFIKPVKIIKAKE